MHRDRSLDTDYSKDLFATVCSYTYGDGCDDCPGGSYNPAADGTDTDSDGQCDLTDPDIDGDGSLNADDSNDFDATVCSDTDDNAGDAAPRGTYNPAADRTDTDREGRYHLTATGHGRDEPLQAVDYNDLAPPVLSYPPSRAC